MPASVERLLLLTAALPHPLVLPSYRLLRLDHSVMGGQYVAPPDVAGQSSECRIRPACLLYGLRGACALLCEEPLPLPPADRSQLPPPAVYTAFYLQSAAAVLAPGGARSLHVGLGVGSGVQALQRLGVAAGTLACPCPCMCLACFGLGLPRGRETTSSATRQHSSAALPHPTLQTCWSCTQK